MAKGLSKANQRRIEEQEAELNKLMSQYRDEPNSENKENNAKEAAETLPAPELTSTEENKEVKTPSSEEETFEKRYKDAQRYITSLKRKLAELEAEKSEKPPKTEEELKEWMEKYPDVAGIVRTLIMKENSSFTDKLSQVDELRRELTKSKTEAKIMEKHPDYRRILDTSEFHRWAESLSPTLQAALYEDVDRPEDVIFILNTYKLQNKSEEPEEKKGLVGKGAESVKAKGPAAPVKETADDGKKRYRESEIQKMPNHEFQAAYDDIMAARKENRIIYDISGKNR